MERNRSTRRLEPIASELTYHEICNAFIDLFVQVLDDIRVSDAIDCTAKNVLLREVGKFTRNVGKRTVVS